MKLILYSFVHSVDDAQFLMTEWAGKPELRNLFQREGFHSLHKGQGGSSNGLLVHFLFRCGRALDRNMRQREEENEGKERPRWSSETFWLPFTR